MALSTPRTGWVPSDNRIAPRANFNEASVVDRCDEPRCPHSEDTRFRAEDVLRQARDEAAQAGAHPGPRRRPAKAQQGGRGVREGATIPRGARCDIQKNDEIPHDADADAFALSSSPIDAGKEVDRNTAYLQREKDALDVLQRERSANSPVPKSRPTPPGAYPNATEGANHVVVDPAQIPGLGGGGHGERRHFASPNDGGIRAYPSWDDNVGGYTIPAGGVAKMAALSEEMDHLDAAEYERLADAHARRPLAPSPGAFPGHLPENPDYFNDRNRRRTPGPVSFSVAGVDPVEFSRDPRAAAEARIRQEKRDRLRAELDEQVRLKKERERLIKEADDAREKAEVGRASHYDRWGKRGGGGEPLVDDRGHLIAELKGVDIRSPANAQAAASANAMNESLSPGRVAEIVGYPGGDDRAPMAGVPRRGVNPGAGEYSSPFRRAGGGPSSFYLGGEVNAGPDRGKVTGAHHTPAELSMAEVKRLQLIKDLDEQVRIKKEQERIRALEEAIQEAKIERRIQETIEEERRVLALKEAQMAAMNGGEYDEHGDVGFPGDAAAVTTVTTAGGGRVMNSPPAPPRPLTGTEPEPGMPGEDFGDFGDFGDGDVVLDDGLEDFEPPPPPSDALEPEAVTTVTTAGVTHESSEAAAGGDDDAFIPASASPAPAPRPSKVIHSPPRPSVSQSPIASWTLATFQASRGTCRRGWCTRRPRARRRPRRPRVAASPTATSGPCAPRGSLTGTGTLRWTGITAQIDRRRRTPRNCATWSPSWRLTRGGSRRNSTASGGSCTRRSGRRRTPRGSGTSPSASGTSRRSSRLCERSWRAAAAAPGGPVDPSAPRRRFARPGTARCASPRRAFASPCASRRTTTLRRPLRSTVAIDRSRPLRRLTWE